MKLTAGSPAFNFRDDYYTFTAREALSLPPQLIFVSLGLMNAAKKKFGFLLAADIAAFLGYLLWFSLRRYGFFFFIASLLFAGCSSWAAKSSGAELDPAQKRLRARLAAAGYLFFIAAFVFLACLFATPTAWCFAAVGVVVLLCLLYFRSERFTAHNQMPK